MLTKSVSTKSIIEPDISKAKTLPTEYYIDPKYFELAKEKIFAKSWQLIGDTDMLNQAGKVIPLTLLEGYLNEPVLLTRDKNNRLHCLANVCTHRGATLVESECTLTQMRCKYHGRRFDLDGTFISAPGFENACNFPTAVDNLSGISIEHFGKFVFASLEPDIAFNDLMADMIRRLNWLPLDQFIFDASYARDYYVHANWALYIENYLEGLHLPYVHPGLSAYVDIKTYRTELHRFGNLQIGPAKDVAEAFILPKNSPDYGEDIAAYYYWFFPNTIFNFYPWGLSINIIMPLAVDYTRIKYLTYIWDKTRMNYSPEDINETELEDEAILEQVQRGIKSRFYKRGRYAPNWETGVHQFHTLLAEKLGS